jgi:hypothetical protein
LAEVDFPLNAQRNGKRAARAPQLSIGLGKLIPWQFMSDADSSRHWQLRQLLAKLQQQAGAEPESAAWQLPGDTAAASMRAFIGNTFVTQPSLQVQHIAASA